MAKDTMQVQGSPESLQPREKAALLGCWVSRGDGGTDPGWRVSSACLGRWAESHQRCRRRRRTG